MQSGSLYRFKKTEVERLSALKGEDSWYCISDERDQPLYLCHVVGNCLGGTSTFHASREDPQVLFRIEPRRKVLNLTYTVSEGEAGPPIATLKLFASRGMQVRDAGGRELFQVVDPQGKLDKFMQTVLEGCCSAYAIVDDERRIIGHFERRERPEVSSEAPARKGFIGRLLNDVAKALLRDWCARLEGDGKALVDHRPLLAGLVVLIEQSIRLDQIH